MSKKAWSELDLAQKRRIAQDMAMNGSKNIMQPVRPVIDVVTRWGSTLSMLVRYKRIKPDIEAAVMALATKKYLHVTSCPQRSRPESPLASRCLT